ncbi:MAG TPA: glycosyltransferase family 4 protein, partial [Pirellulaceae bacterium]
MTFAEPSPQPHGVETPPSDHPMHVLLWAPWGSGEHYSGPATLSKRLYQQRDRKQLRVSLAHGFPGQIRDPLFEEQFAMPRWSSSAARGIPFTWEGVRWMKRHARRFDVVHGMSGYEVGLRPCFEAQRQGVPTAVMITIAQGDLADKRGLQRFLRLPARRRKLAQRLDALIALSLEIERELLAYGFEPDRIVRIPNFADTDRFRRASDADEVARCRAS